jgi:hypothetical protein
MKPLAIDLFCGLGGWAEGFIMEGYRVIGFDNDPRFAKVYPGEFVLADVRTLDGRRFKDATVIVASPPCQEFSMRFLRKVQKPPSTELVEAAWRIGMESGRPMVLENVQGAREFIGKPRCHRGAYYLWGDVPLLPWLRLPPKVGAVARATGGWNSYPGGRSKMLGPERLKKWGARDRGRGGAAHRAKIPLPLARAVARGFRP